MAGHGARARRSARRVLMRITLFDYGAGNLHSLAKALRGEGRDVRFETDARAALQTDGLVLPGVGGGVGTPRRGRPGAPRSRGPPAPPGWARRRLPATPAAMRCATPPRTVFPA